MTIEPGSAGGKADVGIVGFKSSAGKPAQFLIFPKSLERFDGARVIGIKFDLVAQPEFASVDVLKSAAAARTRGGKRPPSASAKPVPPAKTRASTTTEADDSTPEEPDVIPFEPPTRDATEAKPASRAKEPRSSARPPVRTSPNGEAGKPTVSATERALIREVRAAMKELQRGKSVAAYQRLERALSPHEG